MKSIKNAIYNTLLIGIICFPILFGLKGILDFINKGNYFLEFYLKTYFTGLLGTFIFFLILELVDKLYKNKHH